MDYNILLDENPVWIYEKESRFFFHSDKFLKSQPEIDNTIVYSLVENEFTLGRIVIRIVDDTAHSPYNAPFGFIESAKLISAETILDFLTTIIRDLESRRVEKFHFKLTPDFYDNENILIFIKVLDNLDVTERIIDLNQYIKISGKPFYDLLTANKKSRLNKCHEQGYRFLEGGMKDLDSCYKLIMKARSRRGFQMSMSLEDIKQMFRKHPEHYKLFLLRDSSQIISCAIGIMVSDHIFYDFNHAEVESHLHESPVLALLEGIYAYCQKNDFKFLDLGTSGSDGELAKGVYTFKKEIGALESSKRSYCWKI